jgi:epoxyqueuosine reductase
MHNIPHIEESPPQYDKAGLSQQIKLWAKALGFVAFAILPAQPLPEAHQERLQAWLKQGFHADLSWMERHAHFRQDPQQLVAGTQSILVGLMNYYQPTPSWAKTDRIKVARYAWGKDYHKVLRKRLVRLLHKIKTEVPSAEGRAFTDSAPILEKALAAEAGLGWFGKNTLLLTRSHGSWVFIGQLLLNLPLAYDEATQAWPNPTQHPCGTCTRCIQACPTDALTEPFVLDANKCIAYWTIENTSAEALPESIAQHLQGWVFGCDICAEVCPWNQRFAQACTLDEFSPNPMRMNLSAEEALAMEEDTFLNVMQASPIRRTGWKAFQRNAKATLNTKTKNAKTKKRIPSQEP